MDMREAPIIPSNPELSLWLADLRSKVLADKSGLTILIQDNEDAIEVLTAKWCNDGSGETLTAGMLVYFSAVNTVNLADGSDEAKRAKGFCTEVRSDVALIYFVGTIDNLKIETGITVAFGDTLWLSVTEAGKCTNVRPTSGIKQRVAFATDNGTAAGGTVDTVASIALPGIR